MQIIRCLIKKEGSCGRHFRRGADAFIPILFYLYAPEVSSDGARQGGYPAWAGKNPVDPAPGGWDWPKKSWPNDCKYVPLLLSELLDKMQKSGWIQRRVNEKDRRKINIFLTEDGLGISQQMIEARRDMVNTVFGVLNAQEQEQLEILLSKLISELEKPSEEELLGEKPVI